MDESEVEAQAREVVGRGLSRELGISRVKTQLAEAGLGQFRYELIAYRSLSRTGFAILMTLVLAINIGVGGLFWFIGAWPVIGFCGLDVALIYWAFKVNYRAGRARETIELTPAALILTRLAASGSSERFEFNPYWVRVRLAEQQDGRNVLSLASHGQEFQFARFLSDDERRDFAESLSGALAMARSVRA